MKPYLEDIKSTMIYSALQAGNILLDHWGKTNLIRQKESQSSIVTEADTASEAFLTAHILARHPSHNILGEETGFHSNGSDFTWVLDPLDGTSNFASRLPWFGVLITVLERQEPIMAVMYLPIEKTLYFSAKDSGVQCNGTVVRVTAETSLINTLCAYGIDFSSPEKIQSEVNLLSRLVQRSRNVRTTNSLVDFAFTIDGRMGACLNQSTKIWDIASARLMLKEAGGILTDFNGKEIELDLSAGCCKKTYVVAGASVCLLPQVLEITQDFA